MAKSSEVGYSHLAPPMVLTPTQQTYVELIAINTLLSHLQISSQNDDVIISKLRILLLHGKNLHKTLATNNISFTYAYTYIPLQNDGVIISNGG